MGSRYYLFCEGGVDIPALASRVISCWRCLLHGVVARLLPCSLRFIRFQLLSLGLRIEGWGGMGWLLIGDDRCLNLFYSVCHAIGIRMQY